MVPDQQATRTWIAGVLRDGHSSLAAMPDSTELLSVAEDEGVLPLLECCMRKRGNWETLPEGLRAGLAEAGRAHAVRALFEEHELRRVSSALDGAGIRALVLKGNALAHWLYPQPHLRVNSDIDLLFQGRQQVLRAAGAVSRLGYELAFVPHGSNYEMSSRLIVDGVVRSELDLHERLVNAPTYAGIFAFDELWNASVALPAIGAGLRVLSPPHALAHACLNRALDMQNGVPDTLKLLHDIQLMLERMDAGAWTGFVSMARAKSLCGVALRSIVDTVDVFGTVLPQASLEELRSLADRESLDWHRLDDWRYMQWQNLKALPTFGARLRWLVERLFPTRDHLRQLHGEGNWWRLMGRRFANAFAKWRRPSV
jgi:hypothetical protein